MDLLLNIIFYSILAFAPLSLIFVLALDKKSKLRNEIIDNARQKRDNDTNVYKYPETDWINDPAHSGLSGNIYHNNLSNNTNWVDDPSYSNIPGNVFYNNFGHKD